MSDISIPNIAIIGGGPMALLSAYYINLLLPTSSIVILDNRGRYTRGDGWEISISVEVISYLKQTFSNDINFIKFLDNITKILNKCNTFPINALEIALYNNLKRKIYTIKCNVSLDEDNILVINKIDNTNLSEDCCKKQIDFLKRFKIDYILNCTGGRLNTGIYWKSTIDDTREYLTELTNKCLQNAGITEQNLSKLEVSLFPISENPLWYVRKLETPYILPYGGFQEFDKLSLLKPSTKIKLLLGDTLHEYPLFNVGDSIMRVDYRKKIGLALGMSNIRIILDIITNPQDNLEELYVERIVENFDTLSQKLLLFCTIREYLYFVRDHNNINYNYFNLLIDKGRKCNIDQIAPNLAPTWSEDIIKCTLRSNPDNLTEYELNKCLTSYIKKHLFFTRPSIMSVPWRSWWRSNRVASYPNFLTPSVAQLGSYRREDSDEASPGISELRPPIQGGNKYVGKIQNKKTKKRKENKKFKKQKTEKKTKNLKNKKKRTKK